MNTHQRIVWPASIRENLTYRDTPYKLMDRKAGRLARAAWWLLNKLGALESYQEAFRAWEFVPHQQKDLNEAIWDAVSEEIDFIRRGEAVVIIGGDTFRQLAHAPVTKTCLTFQTGPYATHDPYYGRQVFNIPLHVVPNMTGLAVVPKVLIQVQTQGKFGVDKAH